MSRATQSASPAAHELAGELQQREFTAPVALVLGSGLGALVEQLEDARSIDYAELTHMPRSAVPGHAGKLWLGKLGGREVLCQQGRVHLYEGWSAEEVTRAVRAFALCGTRAVVLTNAAGGLHTDWKVPTLMRVVDHLNLQFRTPLGPAEAGFGVPYDDALGRAIDDAARSIGFELHHGVYAGLLGPTYESPAEIRMLQAFGADAIGMSTVAEAVAARAAGARVAAISCITNLGAGLTPAKLDHAEVVEAGRAIGKRFCELLAAAVARFDTGKPSARRKN